MRTTLISEIAETLGVSPADALELCQKAGISTFWHEGQRFDDEHSLKDYLSGHWRWDATPELTFDAEPAQLAAILEPEISQCISDLMVEAINNDTISSYSPNLRRLFAVGRLIQGEAIP